MKGINLYMIRNWVRGLSPIYISICAALLLELKYNIKYDIISILYILGLFFFGLACVLSNLLSNRCNDCGRIYDIKINNYENNRGEVPKLEKIYEVRENKLKKGKRYFQYYGIFVFGFLGLIFIIISNSFLNKQTQHIDYQNEIQQNQFNSQKIINTENQCFETSTDTNAKSGPDLDVDAKINLPSNKNMNIDTETIVDIPVEKSIYMDDKNDLKLPIPE